VCVLFADVDTTSNSNLNVRVYKSYSDKTHAADYLIKMSRFLMTDPMQASTERQTDRIRQRSAAKLSDLIMTTTGLVIQIYTVSQKHPTFTTCYNSYINSSIATIFWHKCCRKSRHQNVLYFST